MKETTEFFPAHHPLQSRIKMHGITFTQLREALNGSLEQIEISMMFSGIVPMPAAVETAIEDYLDFVEDCRAYDDIPDEVSNIVWKEIS